MGQGSLPWEWAQTACRANGDDLASILTQEDYTAFQSITQTQQFDMWIGLYWETSTRMWQWSNGDPFPYCVSEPQLGASNCCSLTHKGHGQTENVTLEKIDCSLKRQFLCTGKKRMKQTIVRMSLKSNSGSDLNDPVVKEQMLEQIRKEIAKNGNFIQDLRWRELPNGEVFRKTVELGSPEEGPAVEIPVFTLVSEGRSMVEAQKFCREYYDELATIFNAEDQTAALRAVSAQSLTDAVWGFF
ncbi:uncharacterized protein LOC115197961 [Salmo trutta]|uniref:uncharacterized protein LOC115197961 n=1 Tax=Salmo trutta TaxID=8032 RepID=UPI001131B876|nr:uncharacterized protein LOC115197961 [Salmo trutta]